ncbi:MAG: hypothetical protein JNJ54_02350 [Myxococcaceae bacterium]|nr:hypothetical protein [Myxococcaceae bacterium]
MSLRRLPLTALAALSLLTCVDVELRSLPRPREVIALDGEFCTGEPYDTARNLRVLFVVDSSSSMRWNDPNDLLVTSIEHLTRRYASQPNISFAIIRWGSSRVVKENVDFEPAGSDPPLFTNDPAKLAAIFARMRQPPTVNPLKYLDGTNYLMALSAAGDYLVTDVAKNPTETLTSRYILQFVTDGMPQSATDDPSITRRNILAEVENLANRYAARTDVTSIAQDVVAPPEFLGLLPAMARSGGGTYTQLTGPGGLDAVFDATISGGANLIDYQLGTAFVWNRQARVVAFRGDAGVHVDSDGDGLIDAQEVELGTNPRAVDSDGDGLTDLFEVRAKGGYDPTAKNVYQLGPDGGSDVDGDSLTAFEEEQLGTRPDSVDTDRDGVPDDLELAAGSDPVIADDTADPDGDRVTTVKEIFEHTDFATAEDPELRRQVAYRWAPPELVRTDRGVRCYSFRVENVGLAHSTASVDLQGRRRPERFNELEVVVLGRAVVGTSLGVAAERSFPVRQFRARRYVITGAGGSANPPTSSLRLTAGEFWP